MKENIEFETVTIIDPATNRKQDAVSVIRNGYQVALLPEADRLRRAMALSLEEVKQIIDEFPVIMNREPTRDENEFWKAIIDYKRSQDQVYQ